MGGTENPYYPASPPNENDLVRVIGDMSNLTATDAPEASPLDPNMSSSRSITSSNTSASARPYVSKVGILPSSLPAYHRDYMEREQAKEGADDEPHPTPSSPEAAPHPRSQADQEETARRLKPHSRSQLQLDPVNQRNQGPTGLTPVNPPKKPKPVRWQFGIRSRNAPWEALVCIYKALSKLGCTWLVDEEYDRVHGSGDGDE